MVRLSLIAITVFVIMIAIVATTNLVYSIGNRARVNHNHELICDYVIKQSQKPVFNC